MLADPVSELFSVWCNKEADGEYTTADELKAIDGTVTLRKRLLRSLMYLLSFPMSWD